MSHGSRQAQKEATRARILDAARALFHAEGFERATIQKIAREAGVSGGSVIAHFPDKSSLVAAAFHEDIEQVVREAWRTLPPRTPTVTALDQLMHFAHALFTWYSARPDLARALLRETLFLQGDWGEAFQRQVGAFTGGITHLLEQAHEDGELTLAAPAALIAAGFFFDYFGTLTGLLTGHVDDPDAALATLRTLTALRLGLAAPLVSDR